MIFKKKDIERIILVYYDFGCIFIVLSITYVGYNMLHLPS